MGRFEVEANDQYQFEPQGRNNDTLEDPYSGASLIISDAGDKEGGRWYRLLVITDVKELAGDTANKFANQVAAALNAAHERGELD